MTLAASDTRNAGERVVTRGFLLLGLATFLAILPAGMLLPTVPLFAREELDARSVGVGIAVGATSLTSFLMLPIVGRLSDRYGRRRFLIAGPLIIAAAAASLQFASALELLVLIRVFAGVGEAMTVVSATTVAADIAPAGRRGEAFSLFSLAFHLGNAVGPVIAIELALGGHYERVFGAACASALASALVATRIRETRPEGARAKSDSLLARQAIRPAVILGLALFGWGGFVAFGALYARDLGLERVGFVFLLFATIVMGIRTLGRRIPDALGPVRCGSVALGLISVGLLVTGVSGSLAGLFVGTAIFAAGQALAFPALLALAVDRTPAVQRAAAVGTVAGAAQVSMGSGAIALGVVVAIAGYEALFICGAVSALTGVVVMRRLGGETIRPGLRPAS
ncbi:MAG TPA: MFS transporter [Gemmatimonadaceae bacterium]|nr:MFS transporter [Gemmatimonadaceae bacterium]